MALFVGILACGFVFGTMLSTKTETEEQFWKTISWLPLLICIFPLYQAFIGAEDILKALVLNTSLYGTILGSFLMTAGLFDNFEHTTNSA